MYFYWHPEEAPKPKKSEDRGGFMYPFSLVVIGWKEFKATGRYPDPTELRRRIKPGFVADIDYLEAQIQSGKPPPPPTTAAAK